MSLAGRAGLAGRRSDCHRDDLLPRDDLPAFKRLGHGLHVLGHGPAAPADQAHALVAQSERARREVLGCRFVDESSVHVNRGACVGEGREDKSILKGNRRERVQQALGAAPAVHPDHVGAGRAQLIEGIRDAVPVIGLSRLVHRELADHGEVADIAADRQRSGQFIEPEEGLQDDRVRTAAGQGQDLFTVDPVVVRFGVFQVGKSAGRTDGPRHIGPGSRRRTGDLDAAGVQ